MNSKSLQHEFVCMPKNVSICKWTFELFSPVRLFPPVRLLFLDNFPTSTIISTSTTIPDSRVHIPARKTRGPSKSQKHVSQFTMRKYWAGSGTYLNFIKYKKKQTLINMHLVDCITFYLSYYGVMHKLNHLRGEGGYSKRNQMERVTLKRKSRTYEFRSSSKSFDLIWIRTEQNFITSFIILSQYVDSTLPLFLVYSWYIFLAKTFQDSKECQF